MSTPTPPTDRPTDEELQAILRAYGDYPFNPALPDDPLRALLAAARELIDVRPLVEAAARLDAVVQKHHATDGWLTPAEHDQYGTVAAARQYLIEVVAAHFAAQRLRAVAEESGR